MPWMTPSRERTQRLENLLLHVLWGVVVPLVAYARGWEWQWFVVGIILAGIAWELVCDPVTRGKWPPSILGLVTFAVGAAIATAVVLL